MIRVLLLALLMYCSACDLINPAEEIPSYIRIDEVSLNHEKATQQITDVWINVGGNAIGVFEVPTIFPVIAESGQELTIRAGIRGNGMSENRLAYPFYTSIVLTPEFNEAEEILFNPEFQFFETVEFVWSEDFELADHTITESGQTDAYLEINRTHALYGISCGAIILEPGQDIYEGAYLEDFQLPKNGSPVFLELDYKSNHTILAGILAKELTAFKQQPVLYIASSEDWNKIYIDLTNTITEFQNALAFSVYFGVARVETDERIEIYLDNINVIKFHGT